MPHILIVHSSSALYGSDKCLLSLLDQLGAYQEFNFSVVIPSHGPLEDKIKQRGIPIFVTNPGVLKPPAGLLGGISTVLIQIRALIVLISLIRTIKPDIVHSNTTRMIAPALAAWLTRVPHTCHVRELNDQTPRAGRMIATLLRSITAHAIAMSYVCKGYFVANTKFSRITVIYDPVDTQGLPCHETKHEAVTTLGMSGWIAERKGQMLFVQVIQELRNRGYMVRGLIAGGIVDNRHRHYYDSLLETIDALGLAKHVELAGYFDDIGTFLKQLDIFIMPSIKPEGAGMSAVEAMGACLPVVGVNLGGVAEMLVDNVTGFLVPPNTCALADKVELLIQNPDLQKKMGLAGRVRCVEVFNPGRSARQMRDVFNQVVLR